jgi:hypothetical protein
MTLPTDPTRHPGVVLVALTARAHRVTLAGVIRLMGLPSVARAPLVRLERTEDAVVLWFLGAEGEEPVQQIAVRRTLLGADEDLETVELDVLARLQRMGYDARLIPPGPAP